MAVQVSYPGVYIDEFQPAAPIQGVSTSVAAFLGLNPYGPPNEPTLITSWDAYQRCSRRRRRRRRRTTTTCGTRCAASSPMAAASATSPRSATRRPDDRPVRTTSPAGRAADDAGHRARTGDR